jgi:hypothetical protein
VVDGSLLVGIGVEGLNGFMPVQNIAWSSLGGDMWKGKVTLAYPAEGASKGFTSIHSAMDIAKFSFAAKAKGVSTLKLTDFKVTGFNEATKKTIDLVGVIEKDSATTSIEPIPKNPYDLNKDFKVDALDLSCILLYIGFSSGQPEWTTLVKVVDSRNGAIYPYMCDFVKDGVINMLDVIDLFINYT